MWACAVSSLHGTPVEFNIPSQDASAALLAFSQQAKVEVLFSSEALLGVKANEVRGAFETQEALSRLLSGTHFTARRDWRGHFAIKEIALGSVAGRLLAPDGQAARHVHVFVPKLRLIAQTDDRGEFAFHDLPAGQYEMIASEKGYLPLRMPEIRVEGRRNLELDTQTIQLENSAQMLDPFVVEDRAARQQLFDRGATALPPRTAVGNLDLPRSEDDALPYTIYDRNQILRSGVVNLNEYLQRELLDGNAGALPPEQNGSTATYVSSSSNLSLRGFRTDETVILVNGRRLPQILTVGSNPIPPDVNFIPLSLVERIEVLPMSASALYSGSPVGGVINIVLRPGADANSTEITTTYTNGLGRNDAPESATSLVHSESFLGGALRIRFSANFTKAEPPSEAQLGYHQAYDNNNLPLDQPVYRATPNIRTPKAVPLFGPGTSSVTSVAPGADGAGGLAAFEDREGVRNFDLLDTTGGYSSSLDTINYGYGREETRSAYYGSVVYDAFPWLELGIDGTYSHMRIDRGLDVFRGDLTLAADSPYNPFHQLVDISLNEPAPAADQNYSEAHLDFGYAVVGALVKFPDAWRGSVDAQFGKNVTRYRGFAGIDMKRWQNLVDAGLYNPLRDSRITPAPQTFYDQVVEYQGFKNQFVQLGDFTTLDVAIRATNSVLNLPMGVSTLNIGADYRRDHLASTNATAHYADGSQAGNQNVWLGRTLQQYSAFTEFQAPLLARSWLPSWLRAIETDSAVRFNASDSKETNVSPTFGFKVNFINGLSLRASVMTTNRYPTPVMSFQVDPNPALNLGEALEELIVDPLRFDSTGKNAQYSVATRAYVDPHLRSEASITQTGGLIYEKGHSDRIRVGIDYVDTDKVNELVVLDAKTVVSLESAFPGRVIRAPRESNDTQEAGIVTVVYTGLTNIASRHSGNWNISFDYAHDNLMGGTIEVYQQSILFTKYNRQLTLANSTPVDELRNPDDPSLDLLRYRANFGVAWYKRAYGFGLDGHYYSSRTLTSLEAQLQGSDEVKAYWQFDAYVQADLTHWLWRDSRFGLTAQVRINNLFDNPFPRYDAESSGSGVQPYGDWRGRVYSASCTLSF